jgi:hypothetical protein
MCALAALSLMAALPAAAVVPFLNSLPLTPTVMASTIPANGDVNPYGVAFVPPDFASSTTLSPGDVLVSNFNNFHNLQGTGSTIVDVTPSGTQSVFYQGPSTGLGLTTALAVLKSGFVLVGNVPTSDGTVATISPGSLIILNDSGSVVETLTDSVLLDGPWDCTVVDNGADVLVFVSNVLNGEITRIHLHIPFDGAPPNVESETKIATGYVTVPNSAALVLGPTGLAYDAGSDSLYVAATGNNAIYVVTHATTRGGTLGPGNLVYRDPSHLRGPLGLVIAPNGDLVTSNGDAMNANPNFPSELVEFTKTGQFVAQRSVDKSGIGGAFGIALETQTGGVVRFAAVDDITNSVDIWVLGP